MLRRIRRIIGFHSIRTSIILSFMALIFMLVLSISAISYTYTVNDFEQLSINYATEILDEINNNIDAYIGNMKDMATVVVENYDVKRLMSYYNRYHDVELDALQQAEIEALTKRASDHMQLVANTRGDITNIAVISKYRDIVLSDQSKTVNVHSSYNTTDWFLRPLSYKDEIFVSPSHVQTLVEKEYEWVISISKAVLDPELHEVTGTMVIDLNYRTIEAICENVNMAKTGYIYIIDPHQNIIYHPQQQLLYSGVKSEEFGKVLAMGEEDVYTMSEDGDALYICSRSETTGWIVVGVIHMSDLIRDQAAMVRFYLMMAYIAIVLAAVVAIFISTSITRPIKALENTMHLVEQGDISIRCDVAQKNEIGHLSKTFNSMLSELGRLMQDVVQGEEEKRKSEIMALQAQINPHFLYNTLDSIIWMSAAGKNDEVVEMTSALAELFRTSISQGSSLVELCVEVQNIESYLTIQKRRYKDKLTYAVDVPETLLRYMTPKLILQPIVENAVYHGIKPSLAGGHIQISVRTEGDALLLVIEDSGVGMTDEQLADILSPREKDSRGIGVNNVHNRIQLVFGQDYGLSYARREGGGTVVTMTLPALEGGSFHEDE